MKNLIRIIPFIFSGAATTVILLLADRDLSFWMEVLLPGLTFGIAYTIAISQEKTFKFPLALTILPLSIITYAALFFITFYSYGFYHGSLIAAGGALLMALVGIRMVLKKKIGNVLPYLLAGFVSWIGIIPAFMGGGFSDFFSNTAFIFLLWHSGFGLVLMLKLNSWDKKEENPEVPYPQYSQQPPQSEESPSRELPF